MRVKVLMAFALGVCFLVFMPMATAVDACDLPEGLQHKIAVMFPGAKLVTLSDLSDDDREFFRKDHAYECPGLVKADFYGDGKPSLALVLIAKSGEKKKAKLVLAHEVGGNWETRIVDTADAMPTPVVWSQPPGEYRDVYGNKEIRATRPVIVFTGYESWSILYAWTGGKVTKIWLRD